MTTARAYTRKPVPDITLRGPVAEDGPDVNRIVAMSPPLDANSLYCNLLQCTHFSETCIVAEQDGELIGFTSAYLLPKRQTTLFIWQVAVAESARGQGLAKRMLLELLLRPSCREVTDIQTSIQPGNTASWRLFNHLADELNADSNESVMFEHDKHFNGLHPEERLLHISSRAGPLATNLKSKPEYIL